MRLSKNIPWLQWGSRLAKFLLLGLLVWALYRELNGKVDAHAFTDLIWQRWADGEWTLLLAAVLLMPVNWSLEILKWRTLLRPFWKIPLSVAVQAVAAGVALSLITPNRVGDYGGRVLAVPAAHNWAAVLATAAGSMAQLIALLSGGLAGAFFYLRERALLPAQIEGMWWLVVLATLLLLAAFFNLPLLAKLLQRINIPERWTAPFSRLAAYRAPVLLQGLIWAFLRYFVYVLQYYLLLRFFGVELAFGAALGGIATIYLLQVCLPLPPLAALLARGEAALLIWAPFSPAPLHLLSATFALFIINLLLPALLGAVFIVKINVLKSLGYDKEAKRYGVGPDASNGIYSPSTPTENE
jgi:hypothetical protein